MTHIEQPGKCYAKCEGLGSLGQFDLSVCIVSHESRSDLPACLESVYDQVGKLAVEVILVDNASTDGSAAFVAAAFPQVRLVVNSNRRGFAANLNHALRLSQGHYILSLNPDTVLLQGALETLVTFMDVTPDAAVAGCKAFYPDGRLQYTCREFPSVATILWRWLHLDQVYLPHFYRRFLLQDWPHDEVRQVDWVLGACMILRREPIFEIGLFDEAFYMYYEDIDVCYRFKQHGFAVYFVPDAQIIHKYHRSSARGFNRLTIEHIKSIVRYFRKHGIRII